MTRYFKFMTEQQLKELQNGNKLPGRGKYVWAFEHTEQASEVIEKIRKGERLEALIDQDFLKQTKGRDLKFVALFDLLDSGRIGPFQRGSLSEYKVVSARVGSYSAISL